MIKGPRFHISLFDGKMNFFDVEELCCRPIYQGIDEALKKTKSTSFEVGMWVSMKKKPVIAFGLPFANEIKYKYLKETYPHVLLENLQAMNALKSLTNKLCFRLELY